jgi:L-cysteine:1D-myo-inositol 2-amino-2-deoxy-alpha-D-glucopyranoside ligase
VALRLYNSLTGRLEPFEASGDPVTIYVCGITPYDTTHLGHAFTYCANDILIRYLEFLGHRVRYAQNVTDIDDDILRKAAEVGQDWQRLGDHWTRHFIDDMIQLNVRPPEVFPRATEVIEQIVEQVEALARAGVAYEAGGSVYFDIDAWPEFGKLSKLDYQAMLPLANERGNHPDDPNKRDPLHFVLWQASGQGEPSWPSPWGPGRPGWHIECSTMVTEYLGEVIDLHSGGADLLFPHHECEIAQVEPVSGRQPFVRYWTHTAMVRHQGEKMSKSLGNLVMVRQLLESYSADALRAYLASHHYRQEWEHNQDELEWAVDLVDKLRRAATKTSGAGKRFDPTWAQSNFVEAMGDDLASQRGLQALEELAEAMLNAEDHNLTEAQGTLRQLAMIFGLRLDQDGAESRVVQGWSRHRQKFTPEEA